MLPMREPIIEPKITKYKLIVIAGGTSVCTQMRIKRCTSLCKMLLNAMRLTDDSMLYAPVFVAVEDSLLATKFTNNSSSRLVLLRILITIIPCSDNCEKTKLSPCDF